MQKKINNLQDIGNRVPFAIPENYFEQFNEEIMHRLPAKEPYVPKKVNMWDKAKPWIYMAAMFIGLYFSIRILTPNMHNPQKQTSQAPAAVHATQPDSYWSNVDISEDEFYQYLEDQVDTQLYYDFLYDEIYQQSL